ncbi:MAG: hypothetical protein COY42_10795 [Armatimonadetes bacterium CG_4_10_14_0_8_um_filter_66_14]|nr:MAG: hypothetical protein COY42_10795 [Armatimonadetes bacterium CG_4_10_14_0_8_um_filter_66_14]
MLSTSAAAPQSYTIQPGDTLSQLAKTMGVPKDELLKLNPHITNEHHIEMFRELNVPKGCELPAPIIGQPPGPVSLAQCQSSWMHLWRAAPHSP